MKSDDKPECFKYAFTLCRYHFQPVSFSIIEFIQIFYLIFVFVLNMIEGNLAMTDLSLSKAKVIVYSIFFK